MIHETAPDSFTANAITKTLSQPGYEGGVRHFFDNVGPCLQAFPAFLAETKYQDVTNATNTAFQRAFHTDLPAFMWLPTQPDRFGPLQQVMTVQGAAGKPWFSVFPFEKELGGFSGPHAFVDVGGGFGHQCLALLAAFPALRGKVVLQELPQTLEQLPFKLEDVEPMVHNFFQPQPVKGARFYYLRNILHDWPDDQCVAILQQLSAAFGSESQILIDEMVLPDSGVPWEAATIDLTIMASLGSRERTATEWHKLLDAAGLKALRIDTYMARRQDSIIQVVAK
jgi:demethylsterigmatocystin 6-O-methyltransferase